MNKLLLLAFTTLLSLETFSQIITDRPDQTESSSTIPVNSLQLETGFVWENIEQGKEKVFAGPSVLLRYSINRTVELRAFNQYENHFINTGNHKIHGLSDLELGLKLQLVKKDSCQTEVALLSHAVIPTALAQLSNQNLGNITKLCVSHSITSWFGLGYNFGYTYLDKTHGFNYSLAFGFSVSEKIGAYVEPYGSYLEGGTYESNFDGGVTYLLKKNIQLDVSYGFGINQNMNYFSLGLSWNFANVF